MYNFIIQYYFTNKISVCSKFKSNNSPQTILYLLHISSPFFNMEYNLVIDDVDVFIDTRKAYNIWFSPKSENAYQLGTETMVSSLTNVQMRKIIASDINFFRKVSINPETISVFYNNHKIGKGSVLHILAQIDAKYSE